MALPAQLTSALGRSLGSEAMKGIVLLAAALAGLIWANSPEDGAYRDVFGHMLTFDLGLVSLSHDVRHWINDGLMTLFFFVIALELKRELLHGELAGRERALLPVAAAGGGMLVPAVMYAAINAGGRGAHGWGIPMATDIAFALGILALLGRRVPAQLRVFVLAMATADDMGSIAVIVLFYSGAADLAWLAASMGVLALIYAMRLAGVRMIAAYVPFALCLWLAVFQSGVSTSLAGVALAMLTPLHEHYGPGAWRANLQTLSKLFHRAERRDAELAARTATGADDDDSPLERLERVVEPYASLLIVPLFALANAGVSLGGGTLSSSLTSPVGLGIVCGRLLGKPLGILVGSWLAVRLGVASLPASVRWAHMLAIGLLGGVGFTVALYVNDLAFRDASLVNEGKVGVMAGALVCGLLACLLLWFTMKDAEEPRGQPE